MGHFRPLERCECGAYRYLAAREHSRTFEIVEIHQTPNGRRNYRKVAGVPKVDLVWHDARNSGLRNPDSLTDLAFELRTNANSILRVVSKLEARDKEEGEAN